MSHVKCPLCSKQTSQHWDYYFVKSQLVLVKHFCETIHTPRYAPTKCPSWIWRAGLTASAARINAMGRNTRISMQWGVRISMSYGAQNKQVQIGGAVVNLNFSWWHESGGVVWLKKWNFYVCMFVCMNLYMYDVCMMFCKEPLNNPVPFSMHRSADKWVNTIKTRNRAGRGTGWQNLNWKYFKSTVK